MLRFLEPKKEEVKAFELTGEILKLLGQVKEETIAAALRELGISIDNSMDKAAKMKRLEKLTIYKFGVGRLLKLVSGFTELQEALLRQCFPPLEH
jgi:hypothetical protein